MEPVYLIAFKFNLLSIKFHKIIVTASFLLNGTKGKKNVNVLNSLSSTLQARIYVTAMSFTTMTYQPANVYPTAQELVTPIS